MYLLGSIITGDDEGSTDKIERRIGIAKSALTQLTKIWRYYDGYQKFVVWKHRPSQSLATKRIGMLGT